MGKWERAGVTEGAGEMAKEGGRVEAGRGDWKQRRRGAGRRGRGSTGEMPGGRGREGVKGERERESRAV